MSLYWKTSNMYVDFSGVNGFFTSQQKVTSKGLAMAFFSSSLFYKNSSFTGQSGETDP